MTTVVFKECPNDFLPQVQVVGVFCEHKGRYLFLRKLEGTNNGNLWGLPAGKVEPGESCDQAALREVWEETGLQLRGEDLTYLRAVYVQGPRDFIFHMYRYKLREEPTAIHLNPNEHVEWRWVTLDEAEELERIPGGRESLHLVYEEL